MDRNDIRIFTVEGAARFLKVCPQSIRNWHNAGLLPAVRPVSTSAHADRLFLQEDLEEFARARAAKRGTEVAA